MIPYADSVWIYNTLLLTGYKKFPFKKQHHKNSPITQHVSKTIPNNAPRKLKKNDLETIEINRKYKLYRGCFP